MGDKLPSFQFYPGDWMKDPNLRRCSHASKGVLIDILCLMFECEERGVLATAGRAWDDNEVAQALGGDRESTLSCIHELTLKGALSRNNAGALFSRRQVRDENKRRLCSAAGKKGGNPMLDRWKFEPGFVYAMQRDGEGPIKVGASVNPNARKNTGSGSLKGGGVAVLKQWPVAKMGDAEACAHEALAKFPSSGEWFEIVAEDLALVEQALVENRHIDTEGVFEVKGKVKGRVKGERTPSTSTSTSTSSIPPPPDPPGETVDRTEPPRKARPPDPVWDCIAEIWHGGTVAKPHASRVGKQARDFKDLSATPEEIRIRLSRLRAAWKKPGMDSAESLIKHWKEFAGKTSIMASVDAGYSEQRRIEEALNQYAFESIAKQREESKGVPQ